MQGQETIYTRTERLLGTDALNTLAASKVAVFGIGGVGGYVVEALARSGVGTIDIIDKDDVSISNINRQLIATTKTVGIPKVQVMKDRIHDINPDIIVNAYQCFYLPETSEQFNFSNYDYIVDAVDTVTAKIELVMNAEAAGTPIISSMGAGNKLEPSMFEVEDIYKTSVCPLAKVMRKELKQRGIKKLKVVYSKEQPIMVSKPEPGQKSIPGSIAFVPSVAGLIIAGEVIKDIVNNCVK
ncbi:tRNA threonylcarbamoyladenosine dehydratase [Aminipila sp.]|uniref:tRNA threonylcarbamoyladenosine dehydratase n=1 Tax=Aminipila sp. TaxID=2060095 RepID=UPI00289EAA97|nr:tRNA threonylcarbamoyladenosine dehydratase [Aminipila sp.]